MPQTKPMTWIKFMIYINILLMLVMSKTFQTMNMKKTNLFMMKPKTPMMKW